MTFVIRTFVIKAAVHTAVERPAALFTIVLSSDKTLMKIRLTSYHIVAEITLELHKALTPGVSVFKNRTACTIARAADITVT